MSKFTKATLAAVVAVVLTSAAFSTVQAASPAKPVGKMAKNAVGKVGVNLRTSRISETALKSQIARAAARKGIKLTSRQLNRAANSAMGKFASAGNGPQKGIIHIRFRRFDICIAWGRDKGSCGS